MRMQPARTYSIRGDDFIYRNIWNDACYTGLADLTANVVYAQLVEQNITYNGMTTGYSWENGTSKQFYHQATSPLTIRREWTYQCITEATERASAEDGNTSLCIAALLSCIRSARRIRTII